MRNLKCALSALLCCSLCGCSAVTFSMDTLLGAPKLTEEQGEIHEALIAAVGGNITLKYPKNGDNRSAYVIADIDDEPDDEALVFYEYNSGGNGDEGLRVNLLDKDEEGKWYSVKELAGAGTEVDRVVISQMGSNGRPDVLVGYQSISGSDCTLEVYSYDKGDFSRIGVDTYTVLETLDINSDGYNELVAIDRSVAADTGAVSAKASLLDIKNGKLVKEDGIEMCSGVSSYANSVIGLLNKEHEAVFIDGVNSEGQLQTEIVYYRYSSLQDPMQQSPKKLLGLCTRPAGYYSSDVDEDGIIEIPYTQPMTGYENAVSEEMVRMTIWSVYEDFFELKEKYRGYYSISDGYFFAFPNRWKGLVTVRKDTETDEIVFYKYEGNINLSSTEIMRVAVTAKNESDKLADDGYTLIENKGQLDYFVKLPSDKREQLILTIDEIKNNFYVLD